MKQFLTFILLLCGYVLCGAQATSLTVDNQTPGWLSSKINYGDQQSVESLTITGYLNATDLTFIGSLMQKQKLRQALDLSETHIVGESSYDDNEISYDNIFGLTEAVNIDLLSMPKSIITPTPKPNTKPFRNLSVNTLIYGSEKCQIYNNALWGYISAGGTGASSSPKHLILREGIIAIADYACHTSKIIETVKCPASMKAIGKRAFGECPSLRDINFPDGIEEIQEKAFSESSFSPDTLRLPNSLSTYYTNAFLIKDGQVIILGNNVNTFENSSWTITKQKHLTFIINSRIPPSFCKGYHDSAYNPSYSDGKELSGCTIYVPKDSYSIYKNSKYDTNTGSETWDGANPYSFATIKTIPVPVTNVTLDHSSEIINVGNSLNILATIVPANADNKSIIWSSSNTNVANVNQNGHVTAISSGKSLIIAKSRENPNISASCEIIVHQPLNSIALEPRNISLKVGESFEDITVTYDPVSADNKAIIWSSSNETVATIDNDGKITAISAGMVKIKATSAENKEISAECTITVIEPVKGISLNKTILELMEEESQQLVASIIPDNASNKKMNWTSSDISIAMVSGDGTVYAIKAGQATIMATSEDGGFVALCKVTVKPKTILAENISFNTSASKLAVGESLQLTAYISPENATSKTLKWSSTNTSVATVDASGLVYAIAQGTTQIVATTTDGSNLSAICDITVEKQFVYVSDLQITPASKRLAIGETFPLDVVIKPSDATNKAIVWSSTNPGVASVSKEGLVTAVSEGEAIIIASSQDGSNLSSTCNVTVYNNVILISSITLDKEVVNGYPNETIQLTANVLPENASNKSLVWNSTNPSVADIDNNGVLTLLQKGSANISVASTDGSKIKAHCAVFVSGMSGIDSVITDKSASVKIYNSTGILVFDGVYSEANLTPGIYIILYNGERFKAKL